MADLVAVALEPMLRHLGSDDRVDLALKALQQPLRTLRQQYRTGRPDFSTESARTAYCVAYHPYHAHLALAVLDVFADAFRFDGPVLRVVVFGAGPAPELLALSAMLSRHPGVERLEVDLVDSEPGWRQSRNVTIDAAIPQIWTGELVVRHRVLDLTTPTDVAEAAQLSRGRDLVFAQAVFTELRMRDRADSFFEALMDGFGPGSLLIASDFSGMPGFADRLESAEARSDLRTLRSAALQCPMPRAPGVLSALYTGTDGLIERSRAKVESRLYVRPGWVPARRSADSSRDVPDQEAAMHELREFVQGGEPGVFVLTGHAGTGKTHLIGRAASEAEAAGRFVELVAPTGQAARRLAQRTGRSARTIHSALYGFDQRVDRGEDPPQSRFELRDDRLRGQLMFVDESSLIGNGLASDPAEADVLFGSGRLLDDLLTTVTMLDGQVVFVGDTYQLPPFGEDRSLALDPQYFESFGIRCETARLTTTNRQESGSGIIELADRCRGSIDAGTPLPALDVADGGDVQRLDPRHVPKWLLQEVLSGEAVVVTFRHADAKAWNRRARAAGDRPSDTPVIGDRIVTVEAAHAAGLLNGEELEVVDVLEQQRVTIRQNSVEILLLVLAHIGVGGTRTEFESWVVKDLLESAPSTEQKRVRTVLWQDFVRRAELRDIKRGTPMFFELLETDPTVNALRCSYSYARTCQRAQGGEWGHAICDLTGTQAIRPTQGRFGYTALTRARSTAWLLQWPRAASSPADHFEDFVAFATDCLAQRVSEPVQRVDHSSGTAQYVSLRHPGSRALVVNLYRTLSVAIQKVPDGVDASELRASLERWKFERLASDEEQPDPCLDPMLLALWTQAERWGMDLLVRKPGDNEVWLSLVSDSRMARLRHWHRADGVLTKENPSGTDGDVELLRLLRAAVAPYVEGKER